MTNPDSITVPVVSVEITEALYFTLLEFAQKRGEDVGEYVHHLFTTDGR